MNFIKSAALTTMIAVGVAFGAEAQTAKKTAKQPVKAKTETPAKVAEAKQEPVVVKKRIEDQEIAFADGSKAVLDNRIKNTANGFSISGLHTTEATNCVQITFISTNAEGSINSYGSMEATDEDKNGIITLNEAKNIFVKQEVVKNKDLPNEVNSTVTRSSGLGTDVVAETEGKKVSKVGKVLRKMGDDFNGKNSVATVFGSQVDEIAGHVNKNTGEPIQYLNESVKTATQGANAAFAILLKPGM